MDDKRRERTLMTEEISKRPEINMNDLKQLVVSTKSAQPTDAEMYVFKRLCESLNANPFLKDIHLVKYSKDSPASFITGKDFFTKVARSQGATWNAGTIVLRNNKVTKEVGSFTVQGDVLVGGWAEVQTKDGTFSHQVSFDEYNNNQSTWKKMPHTMIRKVALVQTLREVFPDRFAGVYDSAEMQQPVEGLDIVAATDPDMPTPEPEIIEVPSTPLVDYAQEQGAVVQEVREVEPVEFKPNVVTATPAIVTEIPDSIICPRHDATMSKRDGKYGEYYSHSEPTSNSGWCNVSVEGVSQFFQQGAVDKIKVTHGEEAAIIVQQDSQADSDSKNITWWLNRMANPVGEPELCIKCEAMGEVEISAGVYACIEHEQEMRDVS